MLYLSVGDHLYTFINILASYKKPHQEVNESTEVDEFTKHQVSLFFRSNSRGVEK